MPLKTAKSGTSGVHGRRLAQWRNVKKSKLKRTTKMCPDKNHWNCQSWLEGIKWTKEWSQVSGQTNKKIKCNWREWSWWGTPGNDGHDGHCWRTIPAMPLKTFSHKTSHHTKLGEMKQEQKKSNANDDTTRYQLTWRRTLTRCLVMRKHE